MVRKKFRKRDIGLGIACTVVAVFILTFYIWHQMESIRMGYETQNLEKKVIELRKDVEKLEAQKSSLLSLENVEKTAKEKLKMDSPREDQIIYHDFKSEF